MAIVMEFKPRCGGTVRVHDDEYVNKTPEQIAAAKRHTNDVIVENVRRGVERYGAEEMQRRIAEARASLDLNRRKA